MKRSLLLALVIANPALLCSSAAAYDDPPIDANQCGRLINSQLVQQLHSRAAHSGLGVASSSSETTWVGHRAGQTGNYWEVGVSPRRPGLSSDGLWSWDTPIKGDSLQGWWPVRSVYNATGGQLRSDRNRAWWAIDIGNTANYRINEANGRTFGVVGVWHRDAGSNAPAPGGIGTPSWSPLGGSYSAWMGLRRHGDNSPVDAITGNPFNEDVLMFNGIQAVSPGGNDKGFPGYGSQMDQILYRDLDLSSNPDSNLTLSFAWRTNMSTGLSSTASLRTGWFDKDPTPVTSGVTNPQPNNFISSSDATTDSPCDSFMVYVGSPVDDGACHYSNGTVAPVYDPQRRWFAEVVRANEGLYREVLSAAGDHSASSFGVTLSHAQLSPMLSASGGRVRIAFRVKTNRGYDDEGTAYSSGGAGAAVIDDVGYRIGSGPTQVLGDFEHASDIDNSLAVDALHAWKSTGKPPALYEHVHSLSQLIYEDICGQVGAPTRRCNMNGVVVSSGDHDHSEAAGGLADGTAEREVFTGMVSPTICLKAPGPSTPNGWDITGDMANVTEDYYIVYDLYTGAMDPFTTGNVWRWGVQSYPGNAKPGSGGYPAWGQMRFFGCIAFNPTKECFEDMEAVYGNGLIATSNASGIPDSIRIYLGRMQECFRFGVSALCSSGDGNYWDNVSLAMVDGLATPMYSDIWHWIQDTFPANESPGYPGVAALFDTTAALIKSGLNTAPQTGNATTRYDIPGDSIVVYTTPNTTRMDLVFRILPGPGNYHPIGDRWTGDLRATPTSPIAIDRNDPHQFWSSYLADNGAKGTPGGHPVAASGPLAGQRVWSPDVWNSARCDTAEMNLYAYQGKGVLGGPYGTYVWMSTYHESDPRGAASRLGIARNRCFVRCQTCNADDIICNGTVPAYVGTAGVPNPATGFDGSVTTVEGTKIVPDGLLTPGSHVEYFWRREDPAVAGAFQMLPDTQVVYPQVGESSLDGERWQHFSVLPDRWKDGAYGGAGTPCMLYVDWNDRRGDERLWVSIADSIGATAAGKYGAHNGWHARGDRDVNDPSGFVAKHGGSPGTTWDMYQVKAAESLTTPSGTLGSRLAYRNPSAPAMANQASRQGPTPEMLAAYYKVLLILTGDLNSGILGPLTNRSADDVTMIRTFLTGATQNAPRGIMIEGDGFVESEDYAGGSHLDLLGNYLGATLRDASYQQFSESSSSGLVDVALQTTPMVAGGKPYRMGDGCTYTNDVLDPSIQLPETEAASYYEDVGSNGPYIASLCKPATPERPWISVVDGWDVQHLRGKPPQAPNVGRIAYFFDVLNQAFASFCSLTGTPLVSLDVPGAGAGAYVDFMRLTNNPLRSGVATLTFGLTRADRVEARIYDVGGRLVRTLAARSFPAGEHRITWDGTDDRREPAPRGVYFTRLRYQASGFEAARKLIVLR